MEHATYHRRLPAPPLRGGRALSVACSGHCAQIDSSYPNFGEAPGAFVGLAACKAACN